METAICPKGYRHRRRAQLLAGEKLQGIAVFGQLPYPALKGGVLGLDALYPVALAMQGDARADPGYKVVLLDAEENQA